MLISPSLVGPEPSMPSTEVSSPACCGPGFSLCSATGNSRRELDRRLGPDEGTVCWDRTVLSHVRQTEVVLIMRKGGPEAFPCERSRFSRLAASWEIVLLNR